MFNFLVVEDNKEMLLIIENILKELCKFKKIDYKIYRFLSYSKEFLKIAQSNLENKIFVCDIEIILSNNKKQNGVDFARNLRITDPTSDVIFLSSFDFRKDVASTIFNCTKYIMKQDNIYQELDATIDYISKRIGKPKEVNIKQNNINYRMQINEINYIKKGKEEKYCYINPNNENHKIKSTLAALNETYFDNEFEIIKRSYLVNTKNIKERTKEYIIFDNNNKLNF